MVILISGHTTIVRLFRLQSKLKVSLAEIVTKLMLFSHSNSSIYDHYLSSDEENGEDEDSEEEIVQEDEDDSIIEDVPSHDIWKGKHS